MGPSGEGLPNPVVEGDLAIATLFSPGGVRAVEIETGALRWHVDLPNIAFAAPLVVENIVFVQTSRTLFALSLSDGSELWEVTPRQQGELSGSLVCHQGLVFLADSGGRLEAYGQTTGVRRWRRDLSNRPHGRINGVPVVVDGRLIVGNNSGNVYALDPESGEILWRRKVSSASVWSTGYQLNGLTVIGSPGEVFGISAEGDVEPLWRFDGRDIEAITATDDSLILNLQERESVLVDGEYEMRFRPTTLTSVQEGRIVWEIKYPPYDSARLTWSPATGLLYEATQHGLGITDPRKGVRRYVISNFGHKDGLPIDTTCIPWVTEEKIYVVTADGSMVAFYHP